MQAVHFSRHFDSSTITGTSTRCVTIAITSITLLVFTYSGQNIYAGGQSKIQNRISARQHRKPLF